MLLVAGFLLGKMSKTGKTAQWQATLSSMPDGLMVFDRDLRLVEWNRQCPEFIGVPAEILSVGMNLEDILHAQASAGEFGPVDVEQEVRRRVALIRSGASIGTIERKRPNGRTLELRRSPMPGGGFVTHRRNRAAANRGPVAASPEDGGNWSSDRRRCARLQQSAHGGYFNSQREPSSLTTITAPRLG
jgi:PAS domain-containing protein